VKKVFDLIGLKPPAGGGRGGGGGGGGGRGGAGGGANFTVTTGDYLVTLVIGNQTYKQKMRVERISGGDEPGNPFGEENTPPLRTPRH